jgi:hypothetical protein
MIAIGGLQVLIFLLISAGGQSTDLVSLLAPQDYFKTHNIAVSTDKLVELAAKEPVNGQAQIAQLLALRSLGVDANFKKTANYASQRKVIEDIAAGSKAQDKQGFAKEYARRALAQIDGVQPPVPAALPGRTEGLAWFPVAVNLVGGLEHQSRKGAGSVARLADLMIKQMPPEGKNEFYKIVDSLGNVEIRRVTFAFQDGDVGKNRIFVRLTGRCNPAWVHQAIQGAGAQTKTHKDQAGTNIIVINADQAGGGPAFAIVGDRDFVVAGFDDARPGNHEALLREALTIRDKKQGAAPSVALKATLAKVPARAVGYLVGDLPEEFRKGAARKLSAMPKGIVAYLDPTYLDPAATGLDFVLKGTMEDEAQAKAFIQTASKLRMDALKSLENASPPPIPGVNLDDFKNMFNSLQLEAKGAEIDVRMLIPSTGLNTMPWFFLGRAPMQAPPAAK